MFYINHAQIELSHCRCVWLQSDSVFECLWCCTAAQVHGVGSGLRSRADVGVLGGMRVD